MGLCNSQNLILCYYLLYFLYIEDRSTLVRIISHTLSPTHESLPHSSLPRSSFSTTFPFYICNYFYLVNIGPESPLLRLRRRRIPDLNYVINSLCSLSSFLQSLNLSLRFIYSHTSIVVIHLLRARDSAYKIGCVPSSSEKDWSILHYILYKLSIFILSISHFYTYYLLLHSYYCIYILFIIIHNHDPRLRVH